MRPQGRITRFLFYFAEAGRPASWFAGQTMKKLTDMADTVDAGGLKVSVIQRPQAVESPGQGLGGALSLPGWNHPGDSSVAYAGSE